MLYHNDSTSKKNNNGPLRLVGAISITAVIFIILLSRIDFHKVVALMKVSRMNFILAALLVSIIAHPFISAYRWRKTVNYLGGSLCYKNSLYIILANGPFENIIPVKAGKLLKALYLAKVNHLPLSLGTVSVVINFIIGIVSLCLMVITGMLSLFVLNPFLHLNIKAFGISGDVTISWWTKLQRKKDNLLSIIKQVRGKAIGIILALAFFMDFLQMVDFYLLAKAVGIFMPFYKILIFVPMVIMISNLPVTIAGLGTREASVLFLFSGYAAKEDLFILGVLFSFVWYILPSLMGIIFVPSFLQRLSDNG